MGTCFYAFGNPSANARFSTAGAMRFRKSAWARKKSGDSGISVSAVDIAAFIPEARKSSTTLTFDPPPVG